MLHRLRLGVAYNELSHRISWSDSPDVNRVPETVEHALCSCTKCVTERGPLEHRLMKLDARVFTVHKMLGAWGDRWWTYCKVTKAVVDFLKVAGLHEHL